MSDWLLVVTEGPQRGTEFSVPGDSFLVGSDPACEVVLVGERVAYRHLQISKAPGGQWFVEDLAGQNTSQLDGQPLSRGELNLGSVLQVGQVKLEVRVPGMKKEPTLDFEIGFGKTRASQEVVARISVDGTAESGEPVKPAPMLTPGEVVAVRYKITDRIAAGGMGEVYRAEHVELGKVFALKMMRAEFSNDANFVERFRREAIASARIGHMNIVDISDFGRTADGRFFFVMEHLEGETLGGLIHRAGAQSVDRVVRIGTQMCDALAAAHHLGIVHRDLKPENVMLLQRPGQVDLVKVLDFGIAKDTKLNAPGQTAMGMVVGTPEYMAPEQAMGMGTDARSDLYSLGLILYELYTGRPPFTGESSGIVISKHIKESPPALIPGPISLPVPRALEDVIFRLLAKRPEQRPQTMAEVKRALAEAALEATSLPSLPPSTRLSSPSVRPRTPAATVPQRGLATPPPKNLNNRPWWLLAVVAVLLGVGGWAAFSKAEPEKTPEPKQASKPVEAPVVVAVPPAVPTEAPVDAGVAPAAEVRPVGLPAEVVPQVAMALTTEPDGVEVYEGEKLLGQTPLTVRRDKGSTVEFRFSQTGFIEQRKVVPFVEPGGVTVKLKKKAAAVKKPQPDTLKGLDD